MATLAPLLLPIACFSAVCYGYPEGAPAEACSDLLPDHTPSTPQISLSPYTLNLAALQASSSLVYAPEQEYESKTMLLERKGILFTTRFR